jgi:hypothetical protein
MTFLRSASLSSVDLVSMGQENFIQEPVVMLSPGKKQGSRGEDIPPVPKLPDLGVLAELQHRARPFRPEIELDKENQSSFETIEEGAETSGNEGSASIQGQWEWPEDVF